MLTLPFDCHFRVSVGAIRGRSFIVRSVATGASGRGVNPVRGGIWRMDVGGVRDNGVAGRQHRSGADDAVAEGHSVIGSTTEIDERGSSSVGVCSSGGGWGAISGVLARSPWGRHLNLAADGGSGWEAGTGAEAERLGIPGARGNGAAASRGDETAVERHGQH